MKLIDKVAIVTGGAQGLPSQPAEALTELTPKAWAEAHSKTEAASDEARHAA